MKRIAVAAACLILLAAGAAFAGGFVYWRSLVASPQYSLAEMIEAARNGDDTRVNEFIDLDEVVEDFVPQVTDEAVELYGRGLPREVIDKARLVAAPVLPAVKERARAELPELLRERTETYRDVPFWAIVIGAGQYLHIQVEDDLATISGGDLERPLDLKMRRTGDKWVVVAVRDKVLAKRIAEKIGQEIILLARLAIEGKLEEAGRKLGIEGVEDLLKQAEEIFR